MNWKNTFWLAILTLLWGPAFLFIKIGLEEVPPFTLVLVRVSVAMICLYVVLRLQGNNLPPLGKIWAHMLLVAFFLNALPYTLISWGEQHVSSALASILNGSTPIYVMLIAHLYLSDDRITPLKMAGIFIGFGGLYVLVAPELAQGFQASAQGVLAISASSASYALAIVYGRKHLGGLPRLVAPTMQLLLASLMILPLSLIVDHSYTLPWPSSRVSLSLLGLALFSTAAAWVVYYHLLETSGATFTSTVTYLTPIAAIGLGIIILDEQLPWTAYVGCALILIGVMLTNTTAGKKPSPIPG